MHVQKKKKEKSFMYLFLFCSFFNPRFFNCDLYPAFRLDKTWFEKAVSLRIIYPRQNHS